MAVRTTRGRGRFSAAVMGAAAEGEEVGAAGAEARAGRRPPTGRRRGAPRAHGSGATGARSASSSGCLSSGRTRAGRGACPSSLRPATRVADHAATPPPGSTPRAASSPPSSACSSGTSSLPMCLACSRRPTKARRSTLARTRLRSVRLSFGLPVLAPGAATDDSTCTSRSPVRPRQATPGRHRCGQGAGDPGRGRRARARQGHALRRRPLGVWRGRPARDCRVPGRAEPRGRVPHAERGVRPPEQRRARPPVRPFRPHRALPRRSSSTDVRHCHLAGFGTTRSAGRGSSRSRVPATACRRRSRCVAPLAAPCAVIATGR